MTAARTRSKGSSSAIDRSLAGGGIVVGVSVGALLCSVLVSGGGVCCQFGLGAVGDGVQDRGKRGGLGAVDGPGRWETSGRRHDAELAFGGDGERRGGGRCCFRVAEVRNGGGVGDLGCGFGEGGRKRGGGFHGSDLLLLLGLVGYAELIFHLHAELVGGAAELGHELAELTGELGQLLRTEEDKGEEKDKGAIAEARHN